MATAKTSTQKNKQTMRAGFKINPSIAREM